MTTRLGRSRHTDYALSRYFLVVIINIFFKYIVTVPGRTVAHIDGAQVFFFI